MRITAKYPGKCRACGSYFEVGDKIEWVASHGCTHIVCPDTKEVVGDYASIEQHIVTTLSKECGLCGSEGLCGCDEPERGNAYLDLMAAFENKGMEVDQIPASAFPVADELFMGLSGIYRKRDKILCIAPTAEHSKLVKEVVK